MISCDHESILKGGLSMTKTVAYFTDRNIEKEQLKNFFQQNNPISKKVLEINGMYGIGKSQMLKWAFSKYYPSDITCAFYNFKFSSPEQTQFLDMLRWVAMSNNKQCPEPYYSDFINLADNAQNDAHIDESNIRTIAESFNNCLSNNLGTRPVFLFYDTTESAHPKTIQILNDYILSKHIERTSIKFAFSGEKPLKWNSEDIRKRRRSLFLETFDAHEMRELIEKILDQEIKIEIPEACIEFCQYLSGGNPGILKSCFDFLAEQFSDSQLQWHEDTCRALVSHVFQIFIADKIIAKLRFDENFDTYKLITHIAMLRKIDLFPFKSIIANYFQKPFSEKSARYYDYLLNQIFTQSNLFKKIEFTPGYRLNKCLRRINQMNVLLNNQSKFYLMKERIQDYYYQRISFLFGLDQISAICEYLFIKYALIPKSLPIPISRPTDVTSELNLLIEQTQPDISNVDDVDFNFRQDSHEIAIKQAIEADEELQSYFKKEIL